MIQQELRHFHEQWRLLTVLLCLNLIFSLTDPALLILSEQHSLIKTIAQLTGAGTIVALAFVGCCLAMVPLLAAGAFAPPGKYERTTVRVACLGLGASAVVWLLLAYLCRNLDAGPLVSIFLRNGGLNLAFAAALAKSINNRQIRDAERERVESSGSIPNEA